MNVYGLHHVTAVTAEASRNVAFYTNVLGLRLVKKTVNQDDTSAYHLFYADGEGNPGTELTFFDWADIGSHVPARGTVFRTAFRAPDAEALSWWESRFDEFGVRHRGVEQRGGRTSLRFEDPEGQNLELAHDEGGGTPPGSPYEQGPVPQEKALRGFDSVELAVQSFSPTDMVLTEVMGFDKTGEYESEGHSAAVFEVGDGGPGARVRLVERPDLSPPMLIGAGGVHHVAFRVADEDELARWIERIEQVGLPNSGFVDRFYFKSLYFREPGGILFEIATEVPGFTVDEDLDSLGNGLSLPPFLENQREQIERNLKPIQPAGYGVS